MNADRAALARHEAGHALVFLDLLATRDFTASISPTATEAADGFAGIVRDERPDVIAYPGPVDLAELGDWREQYLEAMRPNLRRRAINCYAGVAAQFPHASVLSLEMFKHAGIDLRELREWAEAHGFGRDVHERDSEHFRWACEFIDARWGQVLAIAKALEQGGELSGERCAELAAAAPHIVNIRRPWIEPEESRAGGNAREPHHLTSAGGVSPLLPAPPSSEASQ